MAELTNKKKDKPNPEPSVPVEAEGTAGAGVEEAGVDLLEGFSPQQVAALLRVKQAVSHGRYSDLTPEHRKLLFVKWLVEHDRLAS